MSKKMLFGWSAACDFLQQFILTNKITQFWLRLNYKVSIVVRYYAWRSKVYARFHWSNVAGKLHQQLKRLLTTTGFNSLICSRWASSWEFSPVLLLLCWKQTLIFSFVCVHFWEKNWEYAFMKLSTKK